MFFRALRPQMVLGASLPGMIFPAQRPAEGSNSYHYGSHATYNVCFGECWFFRAIHTTMVLTQPLLLRRYYTGFWTTESNKWKDLQSNIEFDFHRFS